jgi:tetratricopeptide (TPR) repeat protein
MKYARVRGFYDFRVITGVQSRLFMLLCCLSIFRSSLAIIVVHLTLLLFCGVVFSDNKQVTSGESYDLIIPKDDEIDALLQAEDFVAAEKLAKQKNLDPRVVATILAFAGKRGEMTKIFLDYLRGVPNDKREDLAWQSVGLVANASLTMSNSLLEELFRNDLLKRDSFRARSRFVLQLLRQDDIDGAAKLVEELLSASSIHVDVKYSAMGLIARLGGMNDKQETRDRIINMLRKKFPDDYSVRIQWIETLSKNDPQSSLIELDKLEKEPRDRRVVSDAFLRLLKARSMRNLGEHERARKIYESLLDTSFAELARSVLDEYRREEERKKLYETKDVFSTVPVQSNWRHRFLVLAIIDIIGSVVIIYLIRRHRNRNRQ